MKAVYIFIILSSTTLRAFTSIDSSLSAPSNPIELFNSGNEAYKNGDYRTALEYYSQVEAGNVESSELYFNIGNANFKSGNNTLAILYYEKARKIDADDEAIKVNLSIANLKTIDKVEAAPDLPFTSWWSNLLNIYTVDEWAFRAVALAYAGLLFLVFYLFTGGPLKRVMFYSAILIFTTSLTFYFLGSRLNSRNTENRYAIIFSSTVTVKSAPEEDATRLFVIHEGTKVEILDNVGEWTEISLMNGNRGWLKSTTYKAI